MMRPIYANTQERVIAELDARVTSLTEKNKALVAALRGMVEAYKDSCDDDNQPSTVRDAIAALAKAEQPLENLT